MEMEIKGIIEKIKEEGINEAEREAERIISEAGKKAKEMIDQAEKKQKEAVKAAEEEKEKLIAHGESALRQASRDTLLSLKESILSIFDNVLKKEIAEGMTSETVSDMIISLAEKFQVNEGRETEVILGEEEKSGVERALQSKLKSEITKGITIKVSPGIEKGFRIKEKDGNAYYDFTEEAVAEAFKQFLNPRIARLLNHDKKG